MFKYTRFFILTALLILIAGTTSPVSENEPPVVEIDLLGCNGSFFFDGVPIQYKVRVRDEEDGSLEDGDIAPEQVEFSIEYIRQEPSSANLKNLTNTIPLEGTYLPPQDSSRGIVVLKASYTDRGVNGQAGLSSEATLVLRSSTVSLSSGELSEGVKSTPNPQGNGEQSLVSESGAYSLFPGIDLTGLMEVRFMAMVPPEGRGGVIEVRVDTPDGPLVGQTDFIRSTSPTQLTVPLEASTGVYDLYLVFRNDEPGEGDLFAVMTAQFIGST